MDIDKIIKEAGDNRAPLFFCNISYDIITMRGRAKKRAPGKAYKIVAKGDLNQIKKDNNVKRRVLKVHFFGSSDIPKKIKGFDLSKIELTDVEVIKFLGYGNK